MLENLKTYYIWHDKTLIKKPQIFTKIYWKHTKYKKLEI